MDTAHIVAATGREAYYDIVQYVIKHGRQRTVRDRSTYDAGFTTILLRHPADALPIGTGRGLVPAIGAAEALQLIGAFSNPQLMVRIAPRFAEFMNGDGFHGAYGSRIRHQALNVATKLQSGDTRQAVITLWDPELDNLADMRDYPCTLALQFQIENGRLCMNTVMRSNDVWLGLPYDMFQFTQLQMTMANVLGLGYGWYRHTALSLHMYDSDLDGFNQLERPTGPTQVTTRLPLGIGKEGDTFTTVMQVARRLARGATTDDNDTESERWYLKTLRPFQDAP